MSKSGGRVSRIVTNLMSALMVAYMIGFLAATPLFNWEYARENGFVRWLLLGEVVATAQAAGWPWFAYQRWVAASDDELHESLEAFWEAHAALTGVNMWESREKMDASLPLLRSAVRLSQHADRDALNRFYSGLGDRFHNDAIAGARLFLHSAGTLDRPALEQAVAAWTRWITWWNEHAPRVVDEMETRYNVTKP